ncbi:MAG TPA: right-handed parallel beta-helix repeat-containing protein, partial [Candidatus Sumerlaeota bacterium]|nr:right-handed parallel beta-helix repeat-containing protein [Candidatus Sumerlaeota bacterium]
EIAGLPYGYYKVFAEAEGWLPQNKFLAMNMPEKVMSFTLKTAIPTPTPTPIQTVTPTPVPTGTPVPETITVGHGPGFDYPSITKALEAAVAGVTILVAPGEYTVQTGEIFPLLIKPGIRLLAMPMSTGIMHMPVIRGDGQSGVIRGVNLDATRSVRTVIRGFMITGGSTTTDVGGGIYSENASLSVESCVIAGNHALGGGGIIVIGGDVIIRESIIRENTSSGWGAGIRLQGQAKTLLLNCLITSNTTSQNGGGVYAREGDHRMVNCTVANNTAISGGGVISSFGGTLHVTNSILWNNAGGDAVLGTIGTNILGIEYSCIGGGYPGIGNISDDPQFAPGWRLFQGSPCIDTADAIAAPPVDLTGQPRPVDGDGDGVALPDMGCFEFRNMNPTPTPTPPPVGVIFGKVV